MVSRNLVGRCGLYCGICEIYRAYRDSEELRRQLAEKHDCSPQDVRCEGCQAIDVFGWSREKEWGKNCKILRCLNRRELTYCYECPDYEPCKKHADFAKICSGLGMDLRQNLNNIQETDATQWVTEQERKWRCPKCGQAIIVSYAFTDCHWCGARLRD